MSVKRCWTCWALFALAVCAVGLSPASRAAPVAGTPVQKGLVAAWDFRPGPRGMVEDLSGHRHHATVRGKAEFVKSPTGRALQFDGETTAVIVRDHPDLVMTSALTLDLWVWIEKVPGGTACVLDKGGERYRLQLSGDGGLFFGLKKAGLRGDLIRGRLKPGAWHRVTCVFEKPTMELYLDGRKVGTRKWDSDIGPGSTLYLGGKAGRHDRFKGRIDQVRIYQIARRPQAGDEKPVRPAGVAGPLKKLTVQEAAGKVAVDTGAMQFDLDTARLGFVSAVRVRGKSLVANDEVPPLVATVFESDTYDGFADYAQGKFIPATYALQTCTYKKDGDAFEATSRGALQWVNGDAIPFEMLIRAEAGSARVHVRVTLDRRGEFKNRFIREVALQSPFALNRRKRIIQAGDRGVQFDTRYVYQYHVHVKFLTEPDHNFWQHIYVDQCSPTDYTIWRSESEATSGLGMFRGRAAAGWMTAYDEQGGALFAYHGLSQRAPKCLYLNASGGGLARISFHAPTHAALDPQDAAGCAQVFGAPHETDWIFFEGEHLFARPEHELAQAWGVEKLASDPPTREDQASSRIRLWDAGPTAGSLAPLVSGGLPLPRGELKDAEHVRLFLQGSEVPLQTKALAFWPDRSIKWLLLTFPLDGAGGCRVAGGQGEGKRLPFDVTLRGDKKVRFELQYGAAARKGAVTTPMTAIHETMNPIINTGPLELVLGKGPQWLRSVKLNGREMLRPGSTPAAFVDFLRTQETYAVGTTHPRGQLDPSALVVEDIRLEEAGPLRAVARLEGYATGKERTRVILRLEAYAGRSFVRLFHSVEFLHKDPRRAFVRRMGLRLPLALDAAEARTIVGAQTGPKTLAAAARTGLRQTSHLHYDAWHQSDGQRYRTVQENGSRSRGWLDFSDGTRGLGVVVRNMWQHFPKELVADAEDGSLTIYLWPESGPLMDVRRYSNYPHRAQGESAGINASWVDKTWYPNDPFVGVSKTHEMLLVFHDASVTGDQIDSLAADFQRPGLVYCGPKWYWDTRITLQNIQPDDEKFRLVSRNMENLARFWMFHQRYWGWYGMWDYGDVRHRFHAGYGRIVTPDNLAEILAMPAKEQAGLSARGLRQRQDYFPHHDWTYDNGRWGWSNTEGLCNLFMQTQYLRTGDRDLYFFTEAMARHVRDVDMRHDGRWFGKGTRHGVQHWSDGNHEERQTTHAEFRFYHYLSGDMRCRDFSDQLTKYYLRGVCRNHASHSGRLYGILTNWEMTGDPQIGAALGRYVHAFIVPEGIVCNTPINVETGKRVGELRGVNGSGMFFDHFGALHALLEYYELTHDEALRDALIKMAQNGKGAQKTVAFAVRYARDPEPYRKALADWVGGKGYRYAFQQVSNRPIHWAGDTAFLVGNVSGGLFWAAREGYVLSALNAEPMLSPGQLAEIKRFDERPAIPRAPTLRESWQSEYDKPEFEEYLTPKRKLEP